MKASEFIKRMKSLVDEFGDLDVVICDDHYYGDSFESACCEVQACKKVRGGWADKPDNDTTVINVF